MLIQKLASVNNRKRTKKKKTSIKSKWVNQGSPEAVGHRMEEVLGRRQPKEGTEDIGEKCAVEEEMGLRHVMFSLSSPI